MYKFYTSALIVAILLFIVIIMLLLHNNIETYTNNNNTSNLSPLTYNNNNNKCCLDTRKNNNIGPIAYNDFCNTYAEQSQKYTTPDEYNKYCATELLLIPERQQTSSKTITETPIKATQVKATPKRETPMRGTPMRGTPMIGTQFSQATPATTANAPVTYPIIKPYGYGSIRGWYDTRKSSYLLDNPITIYYEQMNNNYVNANEPWKIQHFPRIDELPQYEGGWWNWTRELENINKVIDYLGNTLGKFETHFIAATPVTNPLIWVKNNIKSDHPYYAITNTNLTNALSSKINITNSDANIIFTQSEWDSFNITTNLIILHYINIGDKQYRPSSPGTDRVNSEVLAIITRDWKIDSWGNSIPYLSRRAEDCTGVCLSYRTKANRHRLYMSCDLGMMHTPILNAPGFNSQSSDDKKQWLRKEIYANISHEYTHVFQNQLIDPIVPKRWHNIESRERTPNSLSEWWLESFATLLPYFMGFYLNGFDIQNEIRIAINKINNDQSLTATEFSDHMMYVNPYGHIAGSENMVWSFLAAAYMAKLTSWKYVLVDFYYDFQRVPSNTQIEDNQEIRYLPDLDKLFQHNFGKTEQVFLQDIFRDVRNGSITMEYLSNVLPNGNDFNIPNLVSFDATTLN